MTSPFQGGARSRDFILTEICHFTVCFTVCILNSQMVLSIAQKTFIYSVSKLCLLPRPKGLRGQGTSHHL